MRLFTSFVKNELLCSRSSRSSGVSSRSSGVFLNSFLYFLGFLHYFFCRLCSCISSRSGNFSRSSCRSSRRSESYCGERNCYEGGYECGHDFFHLYYLQRNVIVQVIAGGVPIAQYLYKILILMALRSIRVLWTDPTRPHTQQQLPQMRHFSRRHLRLARHPRLAQAAAGLGHTIKLSNRLGNSTVDILTTNSLVVPLPGQGTSRATADAGGARYPVPLSNRR